MNVKFVKGDWGRPANGKWQIADGQVRGQAARCSYPTGVYRGVHWTCGHFITVSADVRDSHGSQDLHGDFLEVRRNAGFRGNMKVVYESLTHSLPLARPSRACGFAPIPF